MHKSLANSEPLDLHNRGLGELGVSVPRLGRRCENRIFSFQTLSFEVSGRETSYSPALVLLRGQLLICLVIFPGGRSSF